jgi:hypothetical protein
VLPLLAVFLLTFHGLKLSRLMTWSRRNVVASKALMGVFFLALAAAVWLLR